jgi:beta-ketoacyl-acyl-carrier-protein synthase II
MGTVNSIGLDVQSTWESLLAGVSGVGPITLMDVSDLNVRIGCEVKNFDPTIVLSEKEARRTDRFEQFAFAAAEQAIRQSGLDLEKVDLNRVGVVISTSIGGMQSMQSGIIDMIEKGPRRISAFLIPMFMPNGPAGMLSIHYGMHGPSYSTASACASGVDAIGQGMMQIRAGNTDVMLAGATDATIARIGIAGFQRLGAMSTQNEDYSMTPAPFSRHRDGLVMGEGSAVLVLESLEHAKGRGAEILGEVMSHASTADAFHVTAPAEQGEGGAAAIQQVLQRGRLNPADIDYINAHGTATILNDISETRAIKGGLGEDAYRVPVTSTKSMTGHMMGATGALESVICLKVIETNIVPPTIHYLEKDPECDLDYVPNEPREVSVEVALNNAFGFGGHNAVLAFRAFSD